MQKFVTHNGDKVGEISNDLLLWSQMIQKVPHSAINDAKIQRKLSESSDTSCKTPQRKGISNFRYDWYNNKFQNR